MTVDGPTGHPGAGKTSFLGVSVKVFLEDISISMCRQSDRSCSPGWVGIIQPVEAKMERVEEGEFPLFA